MRQFAAFTGPGRYAMSGQRLRSRPKPAHSCHYRLVDKDVGWDTTSAVPLGDTGRRRKTLFLNCFWGHMER